MPAQSRRNADTRRGLRLTAYLLFINGVIPEDQVLDQQNLAQLKMPLGDNYAPLPTGSRGRRD